jgi:hypothetical protein
MAVGVSMLTFFSTSLDRSSQALAQSVINHIEDESTHLRAAQPVSEGRLNWVFERFGAQLTGNLGTVNFAAECVMRKRNGVHLVMPGKMGPITVFFMPGEMIDTEMPVKSTRFDGRIVPTRWGSIAVVGDSGESLDGLGERLAAAVDWPRQDLAGSGLPGRGRLAAVARIAQQQDS